MKILIQIFLLAITSKNVSAQSYTILLESTHLLNSNWAYPFRLTKQKKIILLSSLLFSYFFSYSQSFEITPSTTTQSMGTFDDIVLKTNATPNIVGMHFGGTLATPAAVSNNSVLFRLTGKGHNGNTFGTNNVGIEYMTTEHWTPSGNGTKN